jgi:hypothetical protein
VPYFINAKGLSRSDTYSKVMSWLNGCNQLSRLKFNPVDKLNYELDHVAKYYPISRVDLQKEKPELYIRLQRRNTRMLYIQV